MRHLGRASIALGLITCLAASGAWAGTASVGGSAQPIPEPGATTPVLGQQYTVKLALTNSSVSTGAGTNGPIAVNIQASASFPLPEAEIVLATDTLGTETPGVVGFVPAPGNGCVSNVACVTGCALGTAGTCVAGTCSNVAGRPCSNNGQCDLTNHVVIGVSGCSIAAGGALDLATIRVQQLATPLAFLMGGRATYKGSTGTCVASVCSNSNGRSCTVNADCSFSTTPGLAQGTSSSPEPARFVRHLPVASGSIS